MANFNFFFLFCGKFSTQLAHKGKAFAFGKQYDLHIIFSTRNQRILKEANLLSSHHTFNTSDTSDSLKLTNGPIIIKNYDLEIGHSHSNGISIAILHQKHYFLTMLKLIFWVQCAAERWPNKGMGCYRCSKK